MQIVPVNKFISPIPPVTKFERFYRYPLMEILVALLFLSPAILTHNMLYIYVIEKLDGSIINYVKNAEYIVGFILFITFYRLYTKFVEKRETYELGFKSSISETGVGFLTGGGTAAIMVVLLAVLGYYRIESFNENPQVLFNTFLARGMGSFVEEFFFRLILFRMLEKLIGTWYGLITVSLVFGMLHYPNPNATLWTSTAIMLSDILLVGAFILTRRIWLVWGIHFGWNYVQNSIFGMANSGVQGMSNWITPIIDGPEFVTGGDFGIEASPIAIAMHVAIGILLLMLAIKRNQIVKPRWKKKPVQNGFDNLPASG